MGLRTIAGDVVKGVVDDVKDTLKEHLDINVDGIKQAGNECCTAARETSKICTTTVSKAVKLVAFSLEMKHVLDGFRDGIDANDLDALGKILGGDKMNPAVSLAREMDDLALACTEQSVKMIDTMDKGIKILPDVLEDNLDKRMEKAKEDGYKDEDPELPDIEESVRTLETLAVDVNNCSPVNMITVLRNAFDGISAKGELCKTMFIHMRDFAEDVAAVTEAIEKFNIREMVGHIHDLFKDIWRCLSLSDLIRSFANAVGRVIKSIMTVINNIMEKIQGMDIYDIISASCGCCEQVGSNLDMNFTEIVSSLSIFRGVKVGQSS